VVGVIVADLFHVSQVRRRLRRKIRSGIQTRYVLIQARSEAGK
jgi:hypothetical protein